VVKWEVTYNMALRKLFAAQGLRYPNKRITNQPEWYSKHTWLSQEQDSFCDWLRRLIKRRHPALNKRRRDMEVGMFNLMYGWKVDDTKTKE
jgi:predicted CopG family antitoxin